MTFAAIRVAQGFLGVDEFLAFLASASAADPFSGLAFGSALALAFLGGLAMNLTPCVLPLIPVNLIVIGRSAKRGLVYGAGMACAYGVLGVAAAVGGVAFGTIQSSPWFNAAVALVFAGLACALFGAWVVDFSRFRRTAPRGEGVAGTVFAFGMGVMSAVLAGACVAPILVSALLLTAKLYAEGKTLAMLLPFAVGLGLAAPWPFLGAGMKVLPKPGNWMKWVNRVFGVVVLGFAVWYGCLAWRGWRKGPSAPVESGAQVIAAQPSDFGAVLAQAKRPVLVDCWATWCKNCAAMERGTLKDPKVAEELRRFTVIRLQAEDLDELKALSGFAEIVGLPAFVIFE